MRTFAREAKSTQRSKSNAPPSNLADDFSRIAAPRARDTIQTKLSITEPEDISEQEADRRADQIMRMGQPSGSANRNQSSHTEAVTHPSAAHTSNGEQALEPEDRQFFESRFSHNFADVRIYADREANESALGIQARAYTVGNEIHFGPGEYRPGTSEGRHLLAHELSHVIQQRSIGQADSLVIQREPETAPKQTPAPKQKTLKDEKIGPDDRAAGASTAQLIDTVLKRNQTLAPYIGGRLKSGFAITEKGKFIQDLSDSNFETAYRKAYQVKPGDPVPTDTMGFFDDGTSEIHLRPKAKFGTALHEAIHRLASPNVYPNFRVAATVSADLLEVLKEGVTAFFTDCVLKDEDLPNFNDANRKNKHKAEGLMTSLGSDGFALIARFNFTTGSLYEIGKRLGLSDKEYGDLKAGAAAEILKRLDKLL